MQHLRDVRDTVLRHWSPSGPPPQPREAGDLPRVDKHFKHVTLLTYLILLLTKKVLHGRFYLKVSASQSWNTNLCGELVLQNISFEIFDSYGI